MSRIMLLSIVLAVSAVASCSKPAKSGPPHATPATPATHEVHEAVTKDPATARKLIADGAVVLDVRTADEYADGHVPSATNLPVDEVAARVPDVDKLVGGDKTRPVVVYCAAGARAAKAKEQLEAAGYTHVVNGGGYDDLR